MNMVENNENKIVVGNGLSNSGKSNKALIITGIVIGILLLAIITNGFGLFNKNSKINVEIGNSPVLGDVNAKLTIFEFSDFSCPFCAAADGKNEEVMQQLKQRDPTWEAPIPGIIEEYVNTGKAKLVFKYTRTHGTGRVAHLVSLCLNEQNLFWEFHDGAFENQENVGDVVKMKEIARGIGANMTLLEFCLGNNDYSAQLNAEDEFAKNSGIKSTPSFIIGDELVDKAVSFNDIKKIIDIKLQST